MDLTDHQEEPRRLGDFEIVRELGRGGMGVVYEARQISLNRRVALKVLSTGLGLTTKAIVRFRREAEAAARLHHTNIVPIYSTGEENRLPYYAMELIEGPSLDQVLEQMKEGEPRVASASVGATTETSTARTEGIPTWVSATIGLDAGDRAASQSDPLSGACSTSSIGTGSAYYDNVARMIADVAEALAHAHDEGVIHRDIKPSNLLLSCDGRLSINDFGLARMLEQPGMTVSGEFMGSPMYMSPEQITAGRIPLDHRTDIYSLGATLYELLTLQPPFAGRQRDQVLSQIMHKEPRRPRSVNKRIPRDLETICLRAMEKDPDRRFQTAERMADDLRRYTNRDAILARRVGPIGKAVKWMRRRPAVAGLAACVFVACVVAAFFAFQARQSSIQQRNAEGQQVLDEAMLAILTGRNDQIEPQLERAEALGVDPGRVSLFRGMADHQKNPAKALEHLLRADELLEESLAAKVLLMRVYHDLGDMDKEFEMQRAFLRMTPRTLDDYLFAGLGFTDTHIDLAIGWLEELAAKHPAPAVHYLLGRAYYFKLVDTYSPGEVDRTIEMVTVARATMPGDLIALRRHALAHLTAADIYRVHDDESRFRRQLDRARAAADYMRKHHADAAHTYQVLTQLAALEGDWNAAIEHAQRANRLATGIDAMAALHDLLYRAGRVQEAQDAFDQLPQEVREFMGVTRIPFVAELQGVEEAIAEYDDWFSTVSGPLAVFRSEIVYSAFAVLGPTYDAQRRSREYLARIGPPVDPDPFWIAVDQFTSGEERGEELLQAATTRPFRMRAHYLIGCGHLARGERQEAVAQFELVERAGLPNWGILVEDWGMQAAALLNRLREDPTWPPWIAVKTSG